MIRPALPITLRSAFAAIVGIAVVVMAGCAATTQDRAAGERAARVSANDEARHTADEQETDHSHFPPPLSIADRVLPSARDGSWMTLDQVIAETARNNPVPEAEPVEQPEEEAGLRALQHYIRGRDAALQGQTLKAVLELRQAFELDPDSTAIMRELARAYIAEGNPGRAVLMYQRLVAFDPQDQEALFNLAMNRANDRRFDESLEMLSRRLSVGPFDFDPAADAMTYFTLSLVLRELGYTRATVDATRRTVDAINELVAGLPEPTLYGRQLSSVIRQQPDLWRGAGDAFCQMGDYRQAIHAYVQARTSAGESSIGIDTRLVYANLRLGRTVDAARVLLDALRRVEDSQEMQGEEELALAAYLSEHIRHDEAAVSLVADELRQRVSENQDDITLARALALFVPRSEAIKVLTEAVGRQPDDLEAAADLLGWLASTPVTGLDDAIAVAIRLSEGEPDRAMMIGRILARQVKNPYELLDGLQHRYGLKIGEQAKSPTGWLDDLDPQDVETAVGLFVGAAVNSHALGRAWRVVTTTRSRLPESTNLALLEMYVASRLEEPGLVRRAIESAPPAAQPHEHLMRAVALRSLARLDDALEHALKAHESSEDDHVRPAPRGAAAAVEIARIYGAMIERTDDDATKDAAARELQKWTTEAIALDPTRLEPYEILLAVFGPGGAMGDIATFREIARHVEAHHSDSQLYQLLVADDEIRRQRYEAALERLLRLVERGGESDGRVLALLMQCWSALDRLEEAQQWLTAQLNQRPHDPALLEWWTRYMTERGAAALAARRLQNLLEETNDHPVALRQLELVYNVIGREEEAARTARRRLLDLPDGMTRNLRLAVLESRHGEYAAARRWLHRVLDDVSDPRGGGTRDHLLSAIRVCSELEEADQAPRSDVRHDHQDDAAYKSHTAHLTIAFIDAYLERDEPHYFIVYGIGLRSLARLGDTIDDDSSEKRWINERSQELLLTAMDHALDPTGRYPAPVAHWTDLAQGLIDEGRNTAAAAILRTVVVDGPHRHEREVGRAVSAYLLASAVADPDADDALRVLAKVFESGRTPMIPTAASTELADVVFEASTMYRIAGNDVGAEQLLRETIRLDPDHAMALNNLGYQLIVEGNDDAQTVEWIERAWELMPDDPHIADTIGWLRYKQGRFTADDEENGCDGALELVKRSIELTEENQGDLSGEVYDHLGDVLWRLNRRDEAVDAWEKALFLLENPQKRKEYADGYDFLQFQVWGLIVAEGTDIEERFNGERREQLRRKLERVEAGDEPPITPIAAMPQ